MSKVREFWLAQRYDDRYEGFELPCGDYSNWKGAVKVIEKSAYDALKKENEELIFQLANRTEKYKIAMDKGVDVLSWKLEKAVEALRFYADGDSWGHESPSSTSYSVIDKEDMGIGEFNLNELTDDDRVGGLRARKFLEENK